MQKKKKNLSFDYYYCLDLGAPLCTHLHKGTSFTLLFFFLDIVSAIVFLGLIMKGVTFSSVDIIIFSIYDLIVWWLFTLLDVFICYVWRHYVLDKLINYLAVLFGKWWFEYLATEYSNFVLALLLFLCKHKVLKMDGNY